jgi:carboxylate-amine ligase
MTRPPASQIPTVGVEEEFFLVSAASGSVAAAAEPVLLSAAGVGEAELLREQVESNSNTFVDLAELADDVFRRRTELAAAAADRGLLLAASATAWRLPEASGHVTLRPRYQHMAQRFGPIAAEQMVNGCHVHVAVPDRENAIAVVGRLGPWLAPLLAVSANSPFWAGADTGYASYRSQIWRRWPATSTAIPFGSAAEYDATADGLVSIGAAIDEGMLYYSARPSRKYPTVELRIADVCLTTAEAIVVAGLSRALVMRCLADQIAGDPVPSVRPELLLAAEWRAGRYGITGELVLPATLNAGGAPRLAPARDVVDALIDFVSTEVDATGDRGRVTAGLDELFRCGNGAIRQRIAYDTNQELDEVVSAVAAATLTRPGP